jgi:hypothetical protein
VRLAGEPLDHGPRVDLVARLAQRLVAEHDDRVGREDPGRARGRAPLGGERLGDGEALGDLGRAEAGGAPGSRELRASERPGSTVVKAIPASSRSARRRGDVEASASS